MFVGCSNARLFFHVVFCFSSEMNGLYDAYDSYGNRERTCILQPAGAECVRLAGLLRSSMATTWVSLCQSYKQEQASIMEACSFSGVEQSV